MKKFNTLELFVGCGGLLDGFESTGLYNTLASVEWQSYACDTVRHRLKEKYGYKDAEKKVLHFDIQRTKELIEGWENDELYGSHPGIDNLIGNNEVDIVVGGPPCQAYSIAGRIQDKDGMKNDYRNYLFESYLEIVKKYRPKLFVFENVEGMLTAMPDGESIVEKIRDGFNTIGFDIIDDIRGNAVIDLSKFGVPQKRKRVILVGLNRDYFEGIENNQKVLSDFYENILSKYKLDQIPTVKDSIGDLMKLLPAEEEYKVNNKKYSHTPHQTELNGHFPRYHNRRDIEIFQLLSDDILSGKNAYISAEALKKMYTEKTGKSSNIHKYHVLRWDQPSNTIPAHLKKDGLRHIHPDPTQARSITVREAARLQTFPDDFDFLGTMSQNYEMIGNAVPPEFGNRLASAIYDFLLKNKKV